MREGIDLIQECNWRVFSRLQGGLEGVATTGLFRGELVRKRGVQRNEDARYPSYPCERGAGFS
jgi:hypothetical protein